MARIAVSDHGDPQGLRHRDRVRDPRARRATTTRSSASSMLINAYLNAPRTRKVGWDFEDEHPGNDARGFSVDDAARPRGRDPPRQRGAHQRRPVLRRPRPPGDQHARVPRRRARSCVFDRAAEEIVRASMAAPRQHAARRRRDPLPQEQLRRQGQQLRLPRELPPGPRDAVRPDRRTRSRRTSSPARSSSAPARSAASCPACRPTTCRSRSASAPTSSRRRSGSRPR